MRDGDQRTDFERHELAGVTFSMKNMYGVVDRPDSLHATIAIPAWRI